MKNSQGVEYTPQEVLEYKEEQLAIYQSRINNKNINPMAQESAKELVDKLTIEIDQIKEKISLLII